MDCSILVASVDASLPQQIAYLLQVTLRILIKLVVGMGHVEHVITVPEGISMSNCHMLCIILSNFTLLLHQMTSQLLVQ
jgi:hypothetical protein